ncbi:MAG: helix-hairpin-helix domain-containing protein [Candidatus Aminicenantes bacterium]|nr:helix-hairpin-helix domain-containing protein [Candidatus Aminicenantes bacterium]
MKKYLSLLVVMLLIMGSFPIIGANNSKGKASSSVLININTATEAQLVKLPGIGPAKAKRIVETRKKLGGFKRIQDIMKVKGIGEKTFNRIKKFIRVK